MTLTRRLTAAFLSLAFAGCASTPPVRVALPSPPRLLTAPQLVQNSRATLIVRPVMLPGYLDSYAIVIERKTNTLVVSDEAEWAERLRDAVTRVLRDTLSQYLGASRVLLRGEHRLADAELVIEFLRLDPSDGVLDLDARWTFVCTGGKRPAHAGRTALQTPLASATAHAVTVATVNGLVSLAEVLASQTWCGKNEEQ